MNKTEEKFKKHCLSKNYYCKKLQTHTATGNSSKQVSDFLIANHEGIYFVECKERKEKSFEVSGLHQITNMLLLRKKSKKAKIYILINFYNQDTVIFIDFDKYFNLLKNLKFKNGKKKKSFSINDFPEENKYTWKTLNF